MLSRLFFTSCLILSIPISAFAQLTIKGTVTDERGEGLPGANIIVIGTTTGTNTDVQGNFELYCQNQKRKPPSKRVLWAINPPDKPFAKTAALRKSLFNSP